MGNINMNLIIGVIAQLSVALQRDKSSVNGEKM